MKWLRSTTTLTYTIEGKVIPSYDKKPLQVSDSVYDTFCKSKVINALIKNGGIVVLSKYEDTDTKNSDAERRLQAQQAQIKALQADLAKAKANEETVQKAQQFDELKAEAEKTIADKDAEIAALKAQLAKQSKKSKTEEE